MPDMAKALRLLRESAPLVHCITNFVTVNDCANILLAAGASPTMAHDSREVEEAVAGARALVCNMGAIEDTEAMIFAGKRANKLGLPVVLDPVAVGGTRLRRECARELLENVQFSVIRGNASEIRYLAGQQATGSGVDVSIGDAVTEADIPQAAELLMGLAKRTGSVIALSGPIDLVADAGRCAVLRNGCATMARITGSGCMLTTLIGGFCAALPGDCFTAACAAMAMMGICGERAEARRIKEGAGNASFRTYLIDAVFSLSEDELIKEARYEIL